MGQGEIHFYSEVCGLTYFLLPLQTVQRHRTHWICLVAFELFWICGWSSSLWPLGFTEITVISIYLESVVLEWSRIWKRLIAFLSLHFVVRLAFRWTFQVVPRLGRCAHRLRLWRVQSMMMPIHCTDRAWPATKTELKRRYRWHGGKWYSSNLGFIDYGVLIRGVFPQ